MPYVNPFPHNRSQDRASKTVAYKEHNDLCPLDYAYCSLTGEGELEGRKEGGP
jgi:hypothetical protein